MVLHPDANNPQDPPTVWIRDSQSKIQYTSSLEDPAWYTLDVLRSSRLTTPANLSGETIINMAENGVDSQVFTSLMKLSIQARVLELLNWEGPNGNLKLWDRVACEGSVFSARFSRLLPGIARVLGQIRDDRQEEWRDEDGLDQLDAAEQEHSVAWWADPISGSPSSLEETVMRLLDAGFSPDKLQVLREKLKKVIKSVIDTYRTKFHIQVAESCCAFVIPGEWFTSLHLFVHLLTGNRSLWCP